MKDLQGNGNSRFLFDVLLYFYHTVNPSPNMYLLRKFSILLYHDLRQPGMECSTENYFRLYHLFHWLQSNKKYLMSEIVVSSKIDPHGTFFYDKHVLLSEFISMSSINYILSGPVLSFSSNACARLNPRVQRLRNTLFASYWQCFCQLTCYLYYNRS